MTLEEFAQALGYRNQVDDGGRSQWYNGDMRLRNGDEGGTLSTLQPWFNRFTTTMDEQGRPVYGTDPFAEGQSEVFKGPDGRAYLRVDNPTLTAQHREVGAKEGDLIYDPQNGYGIEVGLQERWAQKFQQDDTLEKIANNMPIIMGIIFGGAAASGALGGAGAAAAGAGEGAAVAGGAGASSAGAGAAAGTMSPELAAWFSAAGYTPAEVATLQSSIAAAGAGAGAGAALPESYWSMQANGGGVASDAAATGAGSVQSGSTLSAADIAGLQQMGIDAGLSGSSLDAFVASGGNLGSTVAGGGGVGTGFLDAASVTQPGFTTNPSLNALGGGQPGLLPDWLQAIVDKMPPGSGTAAEKAYKYVAENPEKAASLGMSAVNAAGGNDTSAIDSSLALSQQDEANRGALRNQISSIFDSGKYAESDARVADATRQYQTAELKKRYDEQERQLRFGAARSGNTLGSVATTGQQNLQESNRMGGVAIDDAVRRAIASLQSGRETAKQNALGLVNSGAGPEAVQSASQQIQALTDQAAQGDKSDLFSGLFANTATFSPSANAQNPLSAYAAAIRNKGGITAAQPANKPNVFATG